jgi:GTP:adenosylcobinamide-phosphate guanylyltransferase
MSQIRKIKLEAGRTLYKKGIVTVGVNINQHKDEPAHLEIETTSEKYKFDIVTHFQEEARAALKQAGLIK